VGKSVGSIAAPIYGGLLSDLLPDARVTVFGGQSGHIPDKSDAEPHWWATFERELPDYVERGRQR
jgi:hypothetical protein